jgi:hypothetical protein
MARRIFGIRHHGPGSARSLKGALESFEPDCVLVEGPPEANEAAKLVSDENLRPPVALLVHAVEEPRRALFYPFAVFSPEWQALRYAAKRQVPLRFMDLPCANRLAMDARDRKPELQSAGAERANDELSEDPIGTLALAAGFQDREQWWDMQVEQRQNSAGLFEAIAEAMASLREGEPEGAKIEQQREAHMRTTIRKSEKEGFQRIAVVCGAWHAPALVDLKQAKADAELLKGLPKEKVACTWIPWTHSRLAYRSGYGAGVDSPGWYAHVWEQGEAAPVYWAVRAARLFRSQDLDASSASVIETVRLAEALSVLRELPSPGLSELREAILTVLCAGDTTRVAFIRDKLEVGEDLGEVPPGAAQVPVQRDFEREARRLRLKLTTEKTLLELDLRKENDRDRSRLLQRLAILGVDWGESLGSGRTSGTFRENWRLAWRPELVVDLVAANLYGNTVPAAARGRLHERAAAANVAELATLIEVALLADLPDVLAQLLAALDARAAQSADIALLMDATDPLARVNRYGDVRETQTEALTPALRLMFERIAAGLVAACSQLDEDAAGSMLDSINRAHAAALLLEDATVRQTWLDVVQRLQATEHLHPLLRGRACRLLLEQQRITEGELEQQMSLSLSTAQEPGHAARWLEGLLAGDGLFLVHHEKLLTTLDGWVSSLGPAHFQESLPLLRRAFSTFAPAERRKIAQRLRDQGRPGAPARSTDASFDAERAARVLPVLAEILGVERG